MVIEGKDNSGCSVHSPKEHAHLVLRVSWELAIPQHKLPIQSPALCPERRTERTAMGHVTLIHKLLEVVPRDQFVLYSSSREMGVIASHGHHFIFMAHFRSRVSNLDDLATQEKGAYSLPLC